MATSRLPYILVAGVIALCIVAYMLLLSRPSALSPESIVADVKEMFVLESVAFENGGEIPSKYSLKGENISPPLKWSGQPPNTVSLILIMYDPDAPGGIFYHWILYNIPNTLTSLPEGVPKAEETIYGLQGINSYGNIGYGGPSPPPGSRHRYVFLLLALDVRLSLEGGARVSEVLEACRGHIIAYAELSGYYSG